MARPLPALPAVTFDSACRALGDVLDTPARRRLCDDLSAAATLAQATGRLRLAMRTHVWPAGGERIRLQPIVDAFDRRTRAEGFHALHDWDGVADRVNRASIPLDVLDFIARQRGGEPADRATIAILIDYYFVYLLALLSLRVWDDGDAGANLDRLDALLASLHGPEGSGQRFVDDAATLILLATSHYELDERGFGPLLARVRTLPGRQQLCVALGHAPAMGCHLRFGFAATYGRSLDAMRADNAADYPWLAFSLLVTLREYARCREQGDGAAGREPLVEALVNGLSADPPAFLGASRHAAAWPSDADAGEFATLLSGHCAALADDGARLRLADGYSPLAFFFNFSQNVLKGMVIDSLLWGEPSPLGLNAMLRGGSGAAGTARLKMAAALERYARTRPHQIRGRMLPVIVYDPAAGRRAWASVIDGLRGAPAPR